MNHYKATLILILASIVYVISYPFHNTFLGGLIYSGSCASMIGGFADWWGINKLLKRTIPKNKQKIFDGLSNMVSEELLTKETLKKLLNRCNTSKLIVELLNNNTELEKIKSSLKLMIENNLDKISNKDLKTDFSAFIISILKKLDIHRYIVSIIDISLKTEYEDKVFNFILDELILYSQTNDFKNVLNNFIDKTRSSYEHGNIKKKIVDRFKGNNKDLAIDTNNNIEKYLINMKNNNDGNRLILKKWIHANLDDYKNNSNFKIKIEKWKTELLQNVKVEEFIKKILKDSSIGLMKDNNLYDKIFLIIKNQLFNLDENSNILKKLDIFLKDIINKIIDKEHQNISKTVKQNLVNYTDVMLIELIESNVGNDLQLIRINGSLVGGIVGILMFIIKFSIGV